MSTLVQVPLQPHQRAIMQRGTDGIFRDARDLVQQRRAVARLPVTQRAHDLGTVLHKSVGIKVVGDILCKVVPSGTELPTRLTKPFFTVFDNQTSILFEVFEGEVLHPCSKSNKRLHHFTLTGIKKAPKGVPKIQVTFDVDATGMLNVSAIDPEQKWTKDTQKITTWTPATAKSSFTGPVPVPVVTSDSDSSDSDHKADMDLVDDTIDAEERSMSRVQRQLFTSRRRPNTRLFAKANKRQLRPRTQRAKPVDVHSAAQEHTHRELPPRPTGVTLTKLVLDALHSVKRCVRVLCCWCCAAGAVLFYSSSVSHGAYRKAISRQSVVRRIEATCAVHKPSFRACLNRLEQQGDIVCDGPVVRLSPLARRRLNRLADAKQTTKTRRNRDKAIVRAKASRTGPAPMTPPQPPAAASSDDASVATHTPSTPAPRAFAHKMMSRRSSRLLRRSDRIRDCRLSDMLQQ